MAAPAAGRDGGSSALSRGSGIAVSSVTANRSPAQYITTYPRCGRIAPVPIRLCATAMCAVRCPTKGNPVALIDDMAGDFRWPSDVAWHGQPALPLAAAMAHAGVPAVSVAVITGGEVSETAALGVACAGGSPAATPGTLFQAASISKPVAAACTLRLVANGAFGLDEPVDELLRSWQVPANGAWRPRLTVRQLLSHTAGLTVSAFPGYPPGAAIPSLTDVLAGRGNTLPVRVASLPGVQFSYSGGGYCVLQQLLTDVTGLPFPELATELVLGPAGMLDSAYAQPLPAGRQR